MPFDSSQHHRRSLRFRGYDYSWPGAYYLTICIEHKLPLLGKIVEGEAVLIEAGQTVKRTWEMLPLRFPSTALDAFVVMPNHIHGIIQIVAPEVASGTVKQDGAQQAAPLRPTLGKIVRTFKSTSAVAINVLLGRSGRRVWQRNYYEHIVRNWDELEKIRGYIAENPLRWAADRENPDGQGTENPALPWET